MSAARPGRRVIGPRLGALVGALVAGCAVSVNPELALPYRCDPASALGDAQCAGGWRCAADGVCRDPAVGAATACATSSDCLGGWHCGVSGLCYDRTLATAIPCRPAQEDGGTDCAPGWRCPSGGICQQQGVFAAYPCQTTADCEGQGHCGVLGRCYLRDQAEDIPCRPELDADPAARDCAPSWICSANGRCVDAHAYDLRAGGPLSAVQLRAIAPAGVAAADAVAAECYRVTDETCTATTAFTVARGAQLELHPLGQLPTLPAAAVATLPGPILALATTTQPGAALQAYSLVRVGTQVFHVSWPPAGAPVVEEVALSFVPDRLFAPSGLPFFLAVQGPQLALVTRDTHAVLGPVSLPDVGATGTLPYGPVTTARIAQDVWLIALSGEGAFAARASPAGSFQLVDGGTQPLPEWTPVRVPGTTQAACPGDDGGTSTLLAFTQTGAGSFGSGSFRNVRVALVPATGPLAGRPSSLTVTARLDVTPAPCALAGTTTDATACPLCPVGTSLVGVHGALGIALCATAQADGGATVAEYPLSGSCAEPTSSRAPLGSTRLTAVDPGGQLAWGYGGADGQAILLSGTALELPLRLDRAPSSLSRAADGGVRAHAGTLLYTLGDAGFELGGVDPVEGCASVRDAEAYRLTSNGLGVTLSGPGASTSLADSDRIPVSCTPQNRILAEAFPLLDGGQGVIIAGRDRVWADAFPPDGGGAWPVRVSPAPFATITSLAALRSSPDAGAWGSAFVLANEQVFSVEGASANRWSTRGIAGPPGSPFRVWADPQEGRVTYLDGTTYSLPLFSQLSGPLPEPGPHVRELRESCGSAYALGQAGLYRLEPPGVWTLVPAGSAAAGWASLESVGDVLYGFSDQGRAFEVADTRCLRP